jgi:signal transduction histidine kinase
MERVLIVDDVAENRALLRELIDKEFNVTVKEAKDGKEAVRLTEEEYFDIILMDIMMPFMDGYEATRQIKSIEKNKNVAIIFITAQEQEKDQIDKALSLGGIDFISKPIHATELKRLISLYLRFIRKEKEINLRLFETNNYLNEEINKRKKVEIQFLQTQENFKNIVGKSEAAILIIDNKGILKFMNNSAEVIFGRTSSDLLGESFGLIAQFDSKTEINILKNDGSVGVGEITTTKTTWENEPAWLLLINDITGHKELEKNLVLAKEKAQESDRLKSAFLSNMSHEIRTPMNGILGFLEFIDEEDNKSKRQEYTKIIRTCGNHLLNLINDIIDISKIESGQLDIRLGECNIEIILIELYNFFTSNSKIKGQNVRLILDYPINKNEMVIESDSFRLSQILINLIGNALKFTENGSISYGCIIKEKYLEFFVKDSGKGIPENMLNKVFDRFLQVKDQDSAYTQGTGLGLAISSSLVKLLGGEIWVESELNKGSTFYFTIPYVIFKEEYSPKIFKKQIHDIKSEILVGKKVLIAEDEEYNHELLKEILETEGMKTIWAKNGIEALHASKLNGIDLILMDIKMPGMNGLETTIQIRALNNKVPIIAQTAYALEGEKEKCIAAGCDDYIAKPIIKHELINKIKNTLPLFK